MMCKKKNGVHNGKTITDPIHMVLANTICIGQLKSTDRCWPTPYVLDLDFSWIPWPTPIGWPTPIDVGHQIQVQHLKNPKIIIQSNNGQYRSVIVFPL